MTNRFDNQLLRVAFIGTGQMARHHLDAIRRLSFPVVVAGVYDLGFDRAKEFAALSGSHAFSSIDALLDEGRPDVVHVCTPPSAHFDAARRALEGGAHVYIEKPFALTAADAARLLELARRRARLVCAGHQLLRDSAFEQLLSQSAALGTPVQIDSHFAFRPVGPPSARTGARALADQVVDILPHPLYTLVRALERFAPENAIEIAWAEGGPADLQAVLRAGDIVGRLSVSLRARPVASSLTITGTRGSLTCDFVRSVVIGAGNAGTEALEKILNPMFEGTQMISRTAGSLARRLRAGGGYPGLSELINEFYVAVAQGTESPLSPAHLLSVTDIFEKLVARVEAAACRPAASCRSRTPRAESAPLVVVTGARGFLGSRIAAALPRVRAVGRAANSGTAADEWVVADLAAGVPAGACAGAAVVVHAAAETAGGYQAHQRNTIEATRQLLHAMHAAGVRRLVLVSSLSVLRPPRSRWELQHEGTPRPVDPRALGAYTWGKSRQEELVEHEAAALGIATRIVRPGALIDWREPELPGLMGRRLFGRWHLGLGRPGLPIAVCDVDRCAAAIAWCATHFDEAPPVVNLFEPALQTRRAVIRRLQEHGWTGRPVWVPITAVSIGLTAARFAASLLKRQWPEKLAVWSVLRPRRYDTRLTARVLNAASARTGISEDVPLCA
jgi:predicted dehydrogenase/nucleoside-diphosphate-sugar epimerase